MRQKSWGEHDKSLLDKLIEYLRLRKISNFINKGDTVLDLGCGHDGQLLFHFKSIIKKGVGIDLSIKKIVHAKIQLIKGRADTKMKIPSDAFDKITALALAEHVDKPEIMFRESYRILKKRGKLIITTPSIYSKLLLEFLAFKLGIISKEEIADHKRYYDKKRLEKALEKTGFDKHKIKVSYFQMGLNILAVAEK